MTETTPPANEETQFQQIDELVIADLDTLKVVADPLRLEIIELIFEHPHTVKQVAEKLDMPASKLYYHVNLLEKHGVINIARTRIVSGIVEKSYQTTARSMRVQKGLLSPQRDSDTPESRVGILVDAMFDAAKTDIKQNAAAGLIDLSGEENPMSLRISRTSSRLPADKALEFQKRLVELVKEFESYKQNPENANEQGFALVTAIYPSDRRSRPHDSEET
ncbi:MAG: winged helix-turn-helix domain-containing protein [Chloroflexota bacterium]